MKESKYVKLAHTMLCILKNVRMLPLFIHRKSNHIFAVWQHLILLTIRQYNGKSYRMFTEWLVVEAYYLRMFLKLSRIPHFTTLQKFTDRITGTISSFILLTTSKQIFFGIDSSWFKPNHASSQ
ncbi:MAG TPA: hypothetical protein VFJ51_08870, partial [Nitrososphaeraceae archaeon]|nr:hypothetical protein [Nitrososphaeraceae archaeon]